MLRNATRPSTAHMRENVVLAAYRRGSAVQRALMIVVALTALNASFNMIGRLLLLGFPYDTFLFRADDDFADFFGLLESYPGGAAARILDRSGLHALLPDHALWAAVGADGRWPRVTHFHMTPLATLASLGAVRTLRWIDPVLLFAGLTSGLALAWGRIAWHALPRRRDAAAFGLIGLVCYPALMMAVRGNLFAGLTALLLVQALLLSLRRRAPVTAAMLLAVAINLRPNAILFAAPLIAFHWQARWRTGFALAGAGMGVFAASLAASHILYPAYGFFTFLAGLKSYYAVYAVGCWGLAYGSSLFGALKLLWGYHAGLDGGAMIAALAIAGAGFLARLYGRIDDAALLFLTAAAYCLGSTVIADYHLAIFVIVPLAITIAPAPADERAAAVRRIMLVAASLILSPKNYAFWGDPAVAIVSIQIVLNPLILLVSALFVLGGALTVTADAGSGARRSCPRPDFAG